jgi:hypothetical protein
MVRNGGADCRDRSWTRQFDPMQQIPAELSRPQLCTAGAECDPIRHGEVRQHGCDRLEIRRDIVNATLRVGGDAPKIGELEAAVAVEYQIIREVACLWRDDCLHPRPVRLHRDDGTHSLQITQCSDEDTPVLVHREAAGAEVILAENRRNAFVRTQAQHAPAGRLGKQQITVAVDVSSAKHHGLLSHVVPRLRDDRLQAARFVLC